MKNKTKQYARSKPVAVPIDEKKILDDVFIKSSTEDLINTRILPNHEANAFQNILTDVADYHEVRRFDGIFPAKYIYAHLDDIRESINSRSREFPLICKILDLVDVAQKENAARIQKNIQSGVLEFDDLMDYYVKGMEITFIEKDILVGGKVSSVEAKSIFGYRYIEFSVDFYHSISVSGLVMGSMSLYVDFYRSKKKITELPIQPVTPEEKSKLSIRGQRVIEIYKNGPTIQSHQGNLIRHGYWNSVSFVNADGRVVVDPYGFSKADMNGFNSETNRIDKDNYARENVVRIMDEIGYEEAWMIWPWVAAMSFRSKSWGVTLIDNLSPVQWRDDAFDYLVLDEDLKEVIKSLVAHTNGSFSDLIEGKGGGCIFLLHGEPGLGKTLTAESVAELLHRPLYSVSVGELGVKPEALEKRLENILDIAKSWDSVILLDEADIFLEQRDEKDVLRNSMVGIFLRLLEYHQGVLFLTTNRVKNIDEAFYSRVSLAIHYKDTGIERREKIWKHLLMASGIIKDEAAAGFNLKVLSSHALNGRQIKNAIRMSQTLSRSQGKKVDMGMLEKVIGLITSFKL